MPIENRNLKPGDKLVGRYHKQAYVCEVVDAGEGKLRYRLQDGREFKSTSAAGMAITGISCNGWAFWSLETAITPPATEAAQTEANAGVSTTEKEAELQEPTSDSNLVKKSFARTPNRKGVPEGQTRWYCHKCGKSFLVAGSEIPETCPEGHQPS